jgi:hypothetical protein
MRYCFHESGHVTAALALGYTVDSAEVFPRPDANGASGRVDLKVSDTESDRYAVVALAGHLGEARALPRGWFAAHWEKYWTPRTGEDGSLLLDTTQDYAAVHRIIAARCAADPSFDWEKLALRLQLRSERLA